MALIISIRSVFCLCLLQLAATNNTALDIVGTCTKTNDLEPDNWWMPPESYPSPLYDLKVQLTYLNGTPSSFALNISWSINIDSSIHSIVGTWIEVDNLRYRCEYQPPFTSKHTYNRDLVQLWFNFITPDVNIEPSGFYQVSVYNLPPAPPPERQKYLKHAKIQAPGCNDERMKDHSTCLKKTQELLTTNIPQSQKEPWDITVDKIKDEIHVTFSSHANSERYEIRLRRGTHILNSAETGAIETLTAKLKYSGPCEDLKIYITPFFDYCEVVCNSVSRKVNCQVPSTAAPTEETKEYETILLISIGCAVTITFIFICQCWRLRMKSSFHRRGLDSAGPIGVLLVYPAVDSVFQNAVMAIANFLQSHSELNVIIDMWQRGNLAEQGPLRWLISQVSYAEKVLIILPPQHTECSSDAVCLKPSMASVITDYTVPASACELFSLALNLVASCAHDPQQHQKFLVLHLVHSAHKSHKSTVPVQLRSCKALILPRDLEKLLPISNCRSDRCKETARKVRDAVRQLEQRHPMNGINMI
ncbi:interleukin-17 receptor B isoform X2 [Silurus meridionalis]|uniref:interleukin-17 receptor B isoform X2 n=1 Tax=Silurus meridionalis TaxID=175797 RepID=UPI001EEB502B|nr:interleukin-17 receptor B isoform X2 [Silurus meridionalis]